MRDLLEIMVQQLRTLRCRRRALRMCALGATTRGRGRGSGCSPPPLGYRPPATGAQTGRQQRPARTWCIRATTLSVGQGRGSTEAAQSQRGTQLLPQDERCGEMGLQPMSTTSTCWRQAHIVTEICMKHDYVLSIAGVTRNGVGTWKSSGAR